MCSDFNHGSGGWSRENGSRKQELEALANESNPFMGPLDLGRPFAAFRTTLSLTGDPSGLNDPSRVLACQCQAKGYIILITHEPTNPSQASFSLLFRCSERKRDHDASSKIHLLVVSTCSVNFWIMIGDIMRNCHECKNIFEAGMRIYIPLNFRLLRIVQNSNPNFLRTRQRLNEYHAALHQSHLPHRRPKHHLR